MDACWPLMLAAVLLTQPGSALEKEEVVLRLIPVVKKLAVALEVMDLGPNDELLLRNPIDWQTDLDYLQRRHGQLRGAPPLAEAQRFPDWMIVTDLLRNNREYAQELAGRLALDTIRTEEVQLALLETKALGRFWENLFIAVYPSYDVCLRRRALQDVRQALGDRAFYSGELPPNLPVWRLRRAP